MLRFSGGYGEGCRRRLTSFSINGEYTSNSLSERRGCVLRASVENLMVGGPYKHTGQIKAAFAGENARLLLKRHLLFEPGRDAP
jgi:hypothetical protein